MMVSLSLAASAAALLGLAVGSPIAIKRAEDCPEESTTAVADAIRALASTSELPTYPGGYQPLPYGSPSSSSTPSESFDFTITISIPPTAPGIPSTSEAGPITASGPTKPNGTGPLSSPTKPGTNGSSTLSGSAPGAASGSGFSSSNAGATETGPIITIQTVTVTLNSSSVPTLTASAYGSPWAGNTTIWATGTAGVGTALPLPFPGTGSVGSGTGLPQRPPGTGNMGSGTGLPQRPPPGTGSVGLGPGISTTHVTSVITLSVTKTVATSITPSQSKTSSSWQFPHPVIGSVSVSPISGSVTTSLPIITLNITISDVPPSPTWTVPWGFTGPFPTGPWPTGTGGWGTGIRPTGSWASFPTAVPPHPYSFPWPIGTGTAGWGTGVSNSTMVGTGTGTGTGGVGATTTFLTETETTTILSGFSTLPLPPGITRSSTTPGVGSSEAGAESTDTTSSGLTTIQVTSTDTVVKTVTPSSIQAHTPTTLASQGSPVHTANSSLPIGTGTGIGTSIPTSSSPGYYGPWTPTPIPALSAFVPPAPLGPESIPTAISPSAPPTWTTATNTPFPFPSSTTPHGGGVSYMPPAGEEKWEGWWVEFVRWWHGAGRKHVNGRKGGKGDIP